MKFRIVSIVLAVLLLLVLVVAGCAQPAPAPSPKPTPSPSPSPSPKPSPSPTAKVPFDLKLWSFTAGSITYLMAFAEAEIINKYSTWLRAEAVETAGSGKHITDMTSKPELRKNVLFQAPDSSVVAASNGVWPFEKPYQGARAVVVFSDSTMFWATYDKNIKTKDDFKGKRVMYQAKAVSSGLGFDYLLKDVWKIGDTVKISYGDFNAAARALRDGVADIVQESANGLGDVWDLGPIPAQLAAEKPGFRPVSIPAEDILAVNKVSGYLFHPVTYKPGQLKGMEYSEPFTGLANMLAFWADESMDPEVVYEFVRIIYERADEVKARFAGSYLTKNNMAMIPVAENLFHPGALKFYKERNVPIGMKY
ncbi:MAG: TAXI family TRAP transporter solute-binding subunit [Chloroflexota bacterium]